METVIQLRIAMDHLPPDHPAHDLPSPIYVSTLPEKSEAMADALMEFLKTNDLIPPGSPPDEL